MSIGLGRQALVLPEPLSLDHQLLRVHQGREVIVGLRSEAVRIAKPAEARPGEVAISGLVEHVEFQGHEVLVHFNTGSQPAVVPDLEAPRPVPRPPRRRRPVGGVLGRLRDRAGALRAGPVVVLEDPGDTGRTGPNCRLPRAGCPETSSSVRHPTTNSATACRSPSSWTSPICSSSTTKAYGSPRPRRACPTWRTEAR